MYGCIKRNATLVAEMKMKLEKCHSDIILRFPQCVWQFHDTRFVSDDTANARPAETFNLNTL